MEAAKGLSQLRNIKNYVKQVYKHCIESVKPKVLMKKELQVRENNLIIRGNEYKLANNVYVVGFGKAVLEMALFSEELIGGHVRAGAVSIPEGLLTQFKLPKPKIIKIFEGAKYNKPDENAFIASQNIFKMVEPLNENDLLLILVSGGGSALLPYPQPPITLEEKLMVTNQLAKAGVDIVELNAVRKRLSLLKGGKLAKLAYPAKVITLVLSDVVDDSVDIIASGPTVPNKLPPSLAIDVIKKYGLLEAVPRSVLEVLHKIEPEENKNYFNNVQTHIIGNNKIALKAGEDFTAKTGYISKIMTSSLKGDVGMIAEALAKLTGLVCQGLGKTITQKIFQNEVEKIKTNLAIDQLLIDELTALIFDTKSKNKICLLFGGETTVKVIGSGVGGRNQELALRFSVALDELSKSLPVLHLFNVVMLCAGSDGIDGPTDAAGAIAYSGQIQQAKLQNLNSMEYIKENNSYLYYSFLDNGEDLFKYGHTGTNVMDLNILTIQAKE